MDDTTNLNSGLGSSPNWNTATPGAPSQAPATPTTGKAGQVAGTGGGVADADIDPTVQTGVDVDVIVDKMSEAHVKDTQLTITNIATSSYTTGIGLPVLIPSSVNDPALAARTLNLINNPPQSVVQQTVQSLGSILPGVSVSEADAEAAQVVVTDPEINALAARTGVPAGIIQKNVQTEKNSDFASLIQNLSESDQERLTFAFNVPDQAKNLSPALQLVLANVTAKVNQDLKKDFGFSANWQGVATDSTDFLNKLGTEYDTSFEKLLQAKVDDGSITAADAATLRAMHNGLATGSPTLKNLLKTLEGQATAQLQAKYGFDVNYQPKGEVLFYNNVVNGDFSQTYQKMVAKYTGTATAEQKVLLAKYAANPNDPSIPDSIKQLAVQIANEQKQLLAAFPNPDNASPALPDNLKTIAKSLIAGATQAIIEKYGLDTNWKPTITSLTPPGVDQASIDTANTALATAKEMLTQATNVANGLPDGPEKNQFLAFLKVVGEALNSLQEAIYSMQASQSITSKAQSRAKLDAQLNDIDKQQRAADEAREKEGKMAGMGPIGKIFDWIFKIVILAVSIAFGPLAFALALAYFVDSAVSQGMGNKETFTQKMFQEIAKSMPPAAAAVVNLVLATVISLVSCNVFLAINLITQDSQFMQQLVKACGGNEMAQAIAAMVFNMVAQIALMVVMIIVTGGAATGALVAQVGAMVARATGLALETATKAVRIAMIVMQVVISAIQISASAIKVNNNILLSQIDIIKGQAEAYSEEIQGMIAAMKKVIEKLLELLQGNTDAIVSISNFQGKKWDDASQISTDLAG